MKAQSKDRSSFGNFIQCCNICRNFTRIKRVDWFPQKPI
jgi:hypothetical protein